VTTGDTDGVAHRNYAAGSSSTRKEKHEVVPNYRTLDAAMIDAIIASAPEHARRADWIAVLENVDAFTAELES
jgi:hypothetical protein